MSRTELEQYFQWFASVQRTRIDELNREVNSTKGYVTWAADYTRQSLLPLGEWFAKQVAVRSRTERELQRITENAKLPEFVPTNELTERTFSLAIDVGIYFGKVLERNHPSVVWTQWIREKKDVYYGQPVLIGFGKLPCSPVHLVITMAYGVTRGSRDGTSLVELYDIWSKLIRPQA